MGKNAKLRDIVVLGLLHEQPRYGYEIKMIIDHVMAHFLDVSSGSLYYGIKKLQQEGFIEETTIEKVGRRPERSVYKITAAGRTMLGEQLPDYLFPNIKAFFPSNVALFFLEAVAPVERVRRLMMWKERLVRSQSALRVLIEEHADSASWSHIQILKHQLHYVKHEVKFITDMLDDMPELPRYELSTADIAEIEVEVESVLQHFDYDIYHQTFDGNYELTEK